MKKYISLSILSLFILSGCGSSYLENSTNVTNVKKRYDKILVVSKSKDKTARFSFENQVVNGLAAQGVTAKSSMDVIKTDSFDKELTDQELNQLLEAIINAGYDGIIITNLINAAQYTDVVQGNMNSYNVPVRYGRFGGYYGVHSVGYWEPDTIETGMEYTLESCLYDLKTKSGDNLQWIGRFKVKNPVDLMDTIEKYSSELVTELMDQSISN